MKPIRVLIVDDHALVRQGLRKVLELEPGIRVVGEVGDGEAAIAQARRLQPDIVLMDLNMPGTNGVEATRVIKKELPRTKVIALTVDEDDQIFEAIRAGVAAYILKDVEADELIKAIVNVHEGKSVVHPKVTAKLMGEFNRLSAVAADETAVNRLTEREREVLVCLARGASNLDIARMLFISEKTVKNHITSILRKLNVKDRTQAAIYAIKYKLVDL
ncbi:MAG: response regulator transcription factor [Firmicutes bacterium]|nr:response regulator transcription factor [Bacillota bacterium]